LKNKTNFYQLKAFSFNLETNDSEIQELYPLFARWVSFTYIFWRYFTVSKWIYSNL